MARHCFPTARYAPARRMCTSCVHVLPGNSSKLGAPQQHGGRTVRWSLGWVGRCGRFVFTLACMHVKAVCVSVRYSRRAPHQFRQNSRTLLTSPPRCHRHRCHHLCLPAPHHRRHQLLQRHLAERPSALSRLRPHRRHRDSSRRRRSRHLAGYRR